MPCYKTVILSYYQSDEDVGSLRPKSWHKYLAECGIQSHIIYGAGVQTDGKVTNVRGKSNLILNLLKNIRRLFSLYTCLLEPQNLKVLSMLRGAMRYMSINKNEKVILISTYGPFVTILTGFIVKITYPNVIWHVDYRDDWSTNYKKKGMLNFIDSLLERFFSKYYDIVTTVSDGYVDRISANVNGEIHVIPNGFDECEYAEVDASLKATDKIKYVYTGTLNKWRPGVKNFIHALSDNHLSSNTSELLIAGDVGSEISDTNFDGIQTLGLIDRKSALALQKSADYLVFFDTGVIGNLSSKIFEYLGAKRPIIVVGFGDVSGVKALVEPTGLYIGVNDDYFSIKTLLAGLRPDFQPKISEASIQQYTRRSQVVHLTSIYDNAFRIRKN